MAKINDVQVIEKNTGEKIQWEQDGLPSQLRRRRAQRQGYQVSGRRGPHPRRVLGIAAVISCSAPSPGGR